jgi:hypothetical protein
LSRVAQSTANVKAETVSLGGFASAGVKPSSSRETRKLNSTSRLETFLVLHAISVDWRRMNVVANGRCGLGGRSPHSVNMDLGRACRTREFARPARGIPEPLQSTFQAENQAA